MNSRLHAGGIPPIGPMPPPGVGSQTFRLNRQSNNSLLGKGRTPHETALHVQPASCSRRNSMVTELTRMCVVRMSLTTVWKGSMCAEFLSSV